MIGISGKKGTYAIPISKFPVSGLYSLRAMAIDAQHKPIGQFSDAVYCLVTRPFRQTW
jgi:hypothetical protein